MNLFISGTDTDAGKTTVSAWICSKIKTKYWKLVQTGNDSDAYVIKKFAPDAEIISEAYKLKAPLSAYDAAKIENIVIDTKKFHSEFDKIVIEGAGGLAAPIADNFLMIDAIEKTNSAVLLAARSKLGMINHILLSIFALKNRKIPITGIIICGNTENNIMQTIEYFSGEKILAILPESDDLKYTFKNTPVPQEILEILT